MGKEYTNVTLPIDLIERADYIVKKGLYSSRSEFVKDAVRRLVVFFEDKEDKDIEIFKEENERLKKRIEEFEKKHGE